MVTADTLRSNGIVRNEVATALNSLHRQSPEMRRRVVAQLVGKPGAAFTPAERERLCALSKQFPGEVQLEAEIEGALHLPPLFIDWQVRQNEPTDTILAGEQFGTLVSNNYAGHIQRVAGLEAEGLVALVQKGRLSFGIARVTGGLSSQLASMLAQSFRYELLAGTHFEDLMVQINAARDVYYNYLMGIEPNSAPLSEHLLSAALVQISGGTARIFRDTDVVSVAQIGSEKSMLFAADVMQTSSLLPGDVLLLTSPAASQSYTGAPQPPKNIISAYLRDNPRSDAADLYRTLIQNSSRETAGSLLLYRHGLPAAAAINSPAPPAEPSLPSALETELSGMTALLQQASHNTGQLLNLRKLREVFGDEQTKAAAAAVKTAALDGVANGSLTIVSLAHQAVRVKAKLERELLFYRNDPGLINEAAETFHAIGQFLTEIESSQDEAETLSRRLADYNYQVRLESIPVLGPAIWTVVTQTFNTNLLPPAEPPAELAARLRQNIKCAFFTTINGVGSQHSDVAIAALNSFILTGKNI